MEEYSFSSPSNTPLIVLIMLIFNLLCRVYLLVLMQLLLPSSFIGSNLSLSGPAGGSTLEWKYSYLGKTLNLLSFKGVLDQDLAINNNLKWFSWYLHFQRFLSFPLLILFATNFAGCHLLPEPLLLHIILLQHPHLGASRRHFFPFYNLHN